MPNYRVTVQITASSKDQARVDLYSMSNAHSNKSLMVLNDMREHGGAY
jgi:hypothetical protein